MTDAPNHRILAAVGELRPDLFSILNDVPATSTEILLTVPGLVGPYDGLADVVRHPGRRLPKSRADAHLNAILEQFSRQTDLLPRTPEWQMILAKWLDAFEGGAATVRHFGRHPVYSRLLSLPQQSVVPQGPLSLDLRDSQHELRLSLSGSEHARAREWFDGLFTQSLDVTDQVIGSLSESWAGSWASPRDMYYFILFRYYRGIVDPAREDDDIPMLGNLTEFQRAAYEAARDILSRYGGVFLADVVGLGKTFIALALLAWLQRAHGEHAVVVAPPAVLPAWEDLAREFRIELATVSIGKLDDLDKHADREVIVIDESHNFRNKGTLRAEKLLKWLRPELGAASTRKAILLSATPQNNDPSDVENQLRFFPDNFAPLPCGGEGITGFFGDVRAGRASMVDLLQHIVVRRSRSYIKAQYPDAKIKVRLGPGKYEERHLDFPRRVSGEDQCLRYALDATYGKDFLQELLTQIQCMRYPLLGLGSYVKGEYGHDTRAAGLFRSGTALRGLFRVLLLKRLESSAHALLQTLRRLHAKLRAAQDRIATGGTLDAPTSALTSDDAESALTSAGGLPLMLFDVPRLAGDLAADAQALDGLLIRLERLMQSPDEKLARLERYLSERDPRSHRTLVFTQFAETAQYLHDRLGQRFGRTTLVSGNTGGVLAKARRFAPTANRVAVPPEEQIDLLISTDILSEGVNLQDADTIVNYDLHWNPLRLIQRAGRIDRLGSAHEEIHIASFLPHNELESKLKLEEVLRRRISEFIEVFGEDSAVLPSSEQLDPEQIMSAYTGAALDEADESDDVDTLSRHMDELYRLRRDEPEEFVRILGLRPGRRALGKPKASVVATRAGDDWMFWRGGRESTVEQIDVRAAFESLARAAEAGTPEVSPQPTAGLELMETARREFEPLAKTLGQRRIQPRLSAHERFILASLEAYRKDAPATLVPVLDRMEAWVQTGHAQTVLRKHAQIWKRDRLPPQVIFEELRPLVARFPMPRREEVEPELVGALIAADDT